MSLGILGGTFNPVHLAHLRTAEEVREALALDRVIFVPASVPPLKHEGVAPAEHRVEMLRLAVAENPSFEVSELELEREGPSYTVDTLRELGARNPGERLWFIVGTDALAELERWHRPRELLGLASFAVVQRPGHGTAPLDVLLPASLAREVRPTATGLEHASGQEIRAIPTTPLTISASDVRRRVSRGASIRYLVPEPVIDHIRKHHLYREGI